MAVGSLLSADACSPVFGVGDALSDSKRFGNDGGLHPGHVGRRGGSAWVGVASEIVNEVLHGFEVGGDEVVDLEPLVKVNAEGAIWGVVIVWEITATGVRRGIHRADPLGITIVWGPEEEMV
jgi:hypothetical protein